MKTGIKVCDAMNRVPISLESSASIRECAKLMADKRLSSIVIVEKRKSIGLVTEKNIVLYAVALDFDLDKTPVKDIIRSNLIVVAPERDIYGALELMRDNNINHLPVVDNKKMVGFITSKDILRLAPHLFDYYSEMIPIKRRLW
ncbi:CBS domain-containing protein [Candidatus Woesearchaeota archaeon]|jgi:predicted transcriptional regulator|nr:CBS domain-containing protein [Candidatus Woesearchaeota archaeon]